jgi:hypothetical protein
MNIQGLIDEFASAQQCVLNIIQAMSEADPMVQVELLPVLDEAMFAARDCAKELAVLLDQPVYS